MVRIYYHLIVALLLLSLPLSAQSPPTAMQKFFKKWSLDSGDPRKKPLYISAGAMEVKEKDHGVRIWIATEGVHIWQGPLEKPLMELVCDGAVLWFKPGNPPTSTTTAPQKKSEKTAEKKNAQPTAKVDKGAEGLFGFGGRRAEMALFYAEGNVHFRWANNFFRGEQIFFNLLKNRGILRRASLRTQTVFEGKAVPLYLRARKLLIESRQDIVAQDASFSTCQFGDPHYNFAAKQIRIRRLDKGAYLQSRDNTLYAQNIPFFYIPYLAGKTMEQWPIKSFSYGHSSIWGHHVLTTWGGTLYERNTKDDPAFLDNLLWLLDLDVREKRGLAGGPHLKYKGDSPQGGKFDGNLRMYYVHDQPLGELGAPLDETAQSDDDPATRQGRYRVAYLHRHQFQDNWYADVEMSYLTDRNFLTDFFEKELREGRDPETYIYLRKYWDHHAFTLFESWRPNSFQNQIEYLPQGRYQAIYHPLWTDPFGSLYWSSSLELAHLRRADDDENPSEFDRRRILRSDWVNTLHYRFNIGPLNFLPFVSGRMSYFQEGRNEIEDEDEDIDTDVVKKKQYEKNIARYTGSAGFEVATNFYRYFSGVKIGLLEIDGIVHVMTPHVRYQWTYFNSVAPDELVPFDSVETIDKTQLIEFIVTNRLKTRRNGRMTDFLFFENSLAYFPERDLASQGITQTSQGLPVSNRWEKFGNLQTDFRWYIVSNFWVRSRSEFNFQLREFEVVKAYVGWQIIKQISISADVRYYRKSDLITTGTVTFRPSEKWALTTEIQYDVNENELRELKFAVHRVFHRFGFSFGAIYDPVDSNTSFTADFYPLDFFSGGMNRLTQETSNVFGR